MDPHETDLIQRLKQRDATALTALFEQYADRLYRLGLRLLHDPILADDVVQNTFLTLIEHIDSFEGRSNIRTWLYRVAYHDALGKMRQPAWAMLPDDSDDIPMPTILVDWDCIPENVLSQAETHAQMAHAIELLPPLQRAVFTLRDIDELSTQETAEALGLSISSVKVTLHRARLALRERLSAVLADFSPHNQPKEG